MTEDKLGGLTAVMAKRVLNLFEAKTAEEAQAPMMELLDVVGQKSEHRIVNMLRVCDRWAVVGIGPAFASCWQLGEPLGEDRLDSLVQYQVVFQCNNVEACDWWQDRSSPRWLHTRGKLQDVYV